MTVVPPMRRTPITQSKLGRRLLGALALLLTLIGGGSAGAAEPVDTGRGSQLQALALDPADARHLLLGEQSGLVESHDGGATWSRAAGPLGRANLTALAAVPSHTLYAVAAPRAGGSPGLWHSADSGRTWQKLAGPDPAVTTMAVAMDQPTLYVMTLHDGVFATTDGGTSWQRLAGNLGEQSLTGLAISEHDTRHVLASTTQGLQETVDAGRSWHPVAALGTQPVTPAVFACWSTGAVFVAAGAALYRSDTSGQTWRPIGAAPAGAGRLTAVIPGSTPASSVLVGAAAGLYAAPPVHGTWQPLGVGTLPATDPQRGLPVLARDPQVDGTIYAGYSSPNRLYKSIDGGRHWMRLVIP